MARTFNNGIGMVLVVPADKVDATLAKLKQSGEEGIVMGELTGTPGVTYSGLESWAN